jgi:ABC-2 type transport system permease protein
MWERIREMIIKELKQTLREPKMRATLIMPPLIQLLVFGYAVNLDVEHAKLAWMDQDRSIESRELLEQFTGSGRFTIVRYLESEQDTQLTLDRSEVEGVVRILPGFAADIARGRTAAVQVLVDGTNSNTASIVSTQCTQVIRQFSTKKLEKLQRQQLVGRAVDRPLFAPPLSPESGSTRNSAAATISSLAFSSTSSCW